MAWMPIIASVAGGLLGMMGQEDTNDTNLQIQQQNSAFNAQQSAEQRAWSHNEAQIQRDYQTDMANTTWQRGVNDMRAAGLNPMLAYSQGGGTCSTRRYGTSLCCNSRATWQRPERLGKRWARRATMGPNRKHTSRHRQKTAGS